MLEELGLVGTIQDDDQSPDEPDSESEEEVSRFGHVSCVVFSDYATNVLTAWTALSSFFISVKTVKRTRCG